MKRREFLKTAAVVPALGCVSLPAIAQPETITVSPALPMEVGGDWILHVRQERYYENPRVFDLNIPETLGFYQTYEENNYLHGYYKIRNVHDISTTIYHASHTFNNETNKILCLSWALQMKGIVIETEDTTEDMSIKLRKDDIAKNVDIKESVNIILRMLQDTLIRSVVLHWKLQAGCSREIEVRRCERNPL